MSLQNVRGTKDLFGEDILKYNYIVDLARKISAVYGFQELITPIFEFSEVFERNLGEASDVVMKEVYKFKDRGDNFLSLRPEFTAGIVRAIISNPELNNKFPLKLFSYGPIFRYDRPQKGRYRQFNQINFEYFGNGSFMADVNIIQMAQEILKKLNLGNIKLEINSLGSEESRTNFELALKKYFSKFKNDLSEDSKVRLEKNVLRILDSKDDGDKKLLNDAPVISSYWTDEDKKFFDGVLEKLTFLNIDFEVNKLLVRGLDYYTSTVFEFTTQNLGAQATLLAGGRYDKLLSQMGGVNAPAVGCAAGVERLMLLVNNKFNLTRTVSIVPIDDDNINYCLELQKILFNASIVNELIADGKMKKKMNTANKINSKFAVIVGEDEIKNNVLTVKNLDEASEIKVSLDKICDFLTYKK